MSTVSTGARSDTRLRVKLSKGPSKVERTARQLDKKRKDVKKRIAEIEKAVRSRYAMSSHLGGTE